MARIATIQSVIFLVTLLFVPTHAAQGTRVTSGSFTFASGLGEIHVAGQSGFQMDVHVDITSGIYRSDSRPSMLVGL